LSEKVFKPQIECEPSELICTMVTNHTLWLADSLHRAAWKEFTSTFLNILDQAGIEVHWLSGTKDIWARDYMPIEYAPNQFVDFTYAPTYLTQYPSYRDKLTQGVEVFNRLFKGVELWENKLKVDGGNIIMNDELAILTDRVYSENPEYDHQTIADALADQLERNVLIIPVEATDEIGHADGLVRFAKGNKVLVNEYKENELDYFTSLLERLEDAGLEPWCLPYNPYKNRSWLDATGIYLNFLQVGDKFFVPQYGGHLVEDDQKAVLCMMEQFETDEVYPVPCNNLAKKGGVLNCIGWTRL
jgi:agmatine deiminase